MRNTILALENKMWEAAKNGDKESFMELVSEEAVMVCGGYRCSGSEYGDFISDFGISDFEISCFEIVCETDNVVQVHYIVVTTADSPENADLAGVFHVTSTWVKCENEWKIVFNMDSRIIEEISNVCVESVERV
ncbi:MAG: nuclear transport factor 2 family protein [Lachnospiraceae bacterium]|nr:nuclear transport factor 2 family protein [Lachnospiraceae bacterium]